MLTDDMQCQLFQEWPISGNWSLAMGNKNSLINDSAFLFSYFIIDLAFDLVIMFLPLNEIRKLNLGLQKRLALASIFALGLMLVLLLHCSLLAMTDCW